MTASTHSIELLEFTTGGDASAQPVASIVVLHGLGADGRDFVPVAEAMGLSAVGPVRFVFPSAPVRPVTINAGYEMRAWYDIYPPGSDPAVPRREDEPGLRDSQAIVLRLIERELQRGVPADRVVLMGFSQGCAMTLLAGLRAPQRLAGLVALSGYLPLALQTGAEISDANHGVPVFMAHGDFDDVVVVERGEGARDVLQALGYPVDWHRYPMAHEVCMEEIADLNAWLVQRLVS
ncbi:alpha/beta hydrolase [Hydrogenophaga sp. RWCD_12]|uniref:alpha/beta hydrolase n=1 Tax=Hydrogenophaga sp. RWCD_12 TaxID=3391190 RepID=UPI003984BA09